MKKNQTVSNKITTQKNNNRIQTLKSLDVNETKEKNYRFHAKMNNDGIRKKETVGTRVMIKLCLRS